jgi:hypothetical protein
MEEILSFFKMRRQNEVNLFLFLSFFMAALRQTAKVDIF